LKKTFKGSLRKKLILAQLPDKKLRLAEQNFLAMLSEEKILKHFLKKNPQAAVNS